MVENKPGYANSLLRKKQQLYRGHFIVKIAKFPALLEGEIA